MPTKKKTRRPVFTTLEKYLMLQVIWTWLIATPVLISLLMTLEISRLMAKAAAGVIPPEHIWHLFWLRVPTDLGMVIPMTLFFSILLTFGRLYQGSEVTAFSAGGVDIFTASKGVRWFAVIISFVVAILILFVTPWAQTEMNRIHDEINANANLVGLSPGRFKTLSGGNGRIFYSEKISVDQRELEGVFFYEAVPPDSFRLITAETGELYPNQDGDGKWLVLQDGRQYSGRPGDPDMEILKFKEYGFLMEISKSSNKAPRGRAIPFHDLWGSNKLQHQAELQWRFTLPVMTILLALLAVPLSRTTPRGGKYAGMVPGVLLYMVFSNLFNISYGWIEKGKIESWLGMSWIYALILVLIFFLYLRQGVFLLPWKRR